MDINRIALYLAWKFPPYYGVHFDKLEFIELIRAESHSWFTDDFFKLIDSQDFYSMCLNRVHKSDKIGIVEIIKKLKVPEDAGGLTKNDLIGDKLKELKKEYEEMKKMENSTAKGNRFEDIVCKLFDIFGLKTRNPDKSGVDKFDGAIELDWSNYLIESKWKIDTNKDDVGEFGSKFRDSHLIGTLWLFVFDETPLKEEKLINLINRAKDTKCILLITTKDLDRVFNQEIWIDDLVRKLKRRMAEEGKPFLENN